MHLAPRFDLRASHEPFEPTGLLGACKQLLLACDSYVRAAGSRLEGGGGGARINVVEWDRELHANDEAINTPRRNSLLPRAHWHGMALAARQRLAGYDRSSRSSASAMISSTVARARHGIHSHRP